MSKGSSRSGFTLIEALASVALLTVGVVAILGAYGALTVSQRKARDTETMLRLARHKYDEIVATGALQAATLNGDFADYGEDRYTWNAAVEPTSVEYLSSLTVTVQPRAGSQTQHYVLDGVVFVPPQSTAPPDGGTP